MVPALALIPLSFSAPVPSIQPSHPESKTFPHFRVEVCYLSTDKAHDGLNVAASATFHSTDSDGVTDLISFACAKVGVPQDRARLIYKIVPGNTTLGCWHKLETPGDSKRALRRYRATRGAARSRGTVLWVKNIVSAPLPRLTLPSLEPC
jgi:hypothetical protein